MFDVHGWLEFAGYQQSTEALQRAADVSDSDLGPWVAIADAQS